MKKKNFLVLVALLTVFALMLTGCGKEKAEEEKTARSVEVMTVGKGEIASEFAYTGKAAPSKKVKAFCRLSISKPKSRGSHSGWPPGSVSSTKP